MKKTLLAFCLVAAITMMVFANLPKPNNFSGVWILDTKKTKLPEGSPITGQTLTVKQDDKTVSVVVKTEGGIVGMQSYTYNLDGSETSAEITRGGIKIPVTLTGTVDAFGNLELTRTSKRGETSAIVVEDWGFLDDGTLEVRHISTNPKGRTEMALFYTKKLTFLTESKDFRSESIVSKRGDFGT